MSLLEAVNAYFQELSPLARLDFSSCSRTDRSLLRAMAFSSDRFRGERCWLELEVYAAKAGMSRRTAQRQVNGYVDPRNGSVHVGLKSRGILTEIAPSSWKNKRAVTYQINWDALELNPKMIPGIERKLQRTLPGVNRPAPPGEDTNEKLMEYTGHGDRSPWTRCPRRADTVSTIEVEINIAKRGEEKETLAASLAKQQTTLHADAPAPPADVLATEPAWQPPAKPAKPAPQPISDDEWAARRVLMKKQAADLGVPKRVPDT